MLCQSEGYISGRQAGNMSSSWSAVLCRPLGSGGSREGQGINTGPLGLAALLGTCAIFNWLSPWQ